jgi:Domain of unknown function (DUF5666)
MEGDIMVANKGAGRTSRRTAWISALLVGLATVTFAATPVWAEKIHGKLRGTVDIPGASLTLPLSPGSLDVTAKIFLGGPSGPSLQFTITPSTNVDAEDTKEKGPGGTITLADGDWIEVKGKLQAGKIVATKIKLDNPELEIFGAVDFPGTSLMPSLMLPLSPGSDVHATLSVGGVGGPPLDILITPNTRVRGGTTLTLVDNDFIEVKAVLQSGQLVAVKIGKENHDEVEDEND